MAYKLAIDLLRPDGSLVMRAMTALQADNDEDALTEAGEAAKDTTLVSRMVEEKLAHPDRLRST